MIQGYFEKSSITAYDDYTAHVQIVAISIYIIMTSYYVGNQGSHDVKLQITMATRFRINENEQGTVNVL